ncbi:hypothetical protein [uncultured Methanobrevibacter sp.]|uniref:hypothetical protein n=1 Tax=uncultured Methanobrevibacter sp. TaxID=253161 RepID=UPI0025EBFF1B|nr:hypothetical protein [uncultured Methanobrevibacter sp.]
MEEYFNIYQWQQWADNSKHMFNGIVDGGRIGFLLDGFDDSMVLLTKGINRVDVSLVEGLSDVTLNNSHADIVFKLYPSDVEDILLDYDFKIFNELLEKQHIKLYNLIDYEELDYNGFEHFLSRLGFYFGGSPYCGI